MNIRFVEDRFVEFCCFLALILKRMQHLQNCFEVTLNFDIKEMIEYQFSKNLCNYFKINSEEEILYLCSWVLGQSVGNLDYQTPDRDFILQIVYQLLRQFEKLSGIFFDNRDEVIYQLYGHLRPCYYRLLFQFPIANQLVSKIQNEYRDIYYLVNEVVKQNNQLMGQKISEDEVAYLSIHFASIIEKNGTKITSQTMKAVVVCSNGIGSSAIIFEELRNLFSDILFIGPLAIEEFRKFDITDIDLIFSTSMEKSILESKSPVFFLNPIMTIGEKYNLVRTVYEKIGRYQLPDVNKILQIIGRHTDINASEDLKRELANYLTFQQNIEKKSSEIVLLLSNSGTTQEVLAMLPSLRKIGCKLIAFTSNPESVLAKSCDYVLSYTYQTEADTLGLAPTTSATTMLALGDSIAVTLSKMKNFTADNFHLYHPGGALGEKLAQG